MEPKDKRDGVDVMHDPAQMRQVRVATMSSAQPPKRSELTHSAQYGDDQEDPQGVGLPPLGDEEEEAPFQPDDDSDLGLEDDREGALSERDLADGGDELAAPESLVEAGEEDMAEGDAEPVGDLLGTDPDLLDGEEDGWTDGSDQDEGLLDGLVQDFAQEQVDPLGGDDGEEGFREDEDGLGDLAARLPPMDRPTEGDDEEEGIGDDGGGMYDAPQAGVLDEERSSELDEVAEPARAKGPPGAPGTISWLEVWPGVRWSLLPPTAWRQLDVTTGEAGADSLLAADEHGLYALHQGRLTRHSLRASDVRPARGLPTDTVTLCAGGGVLWAATADWVYRSRDAGASFAPVCACPGAGAPRLGMVKARLPFLSQSERLYRFVPDGDRFVSASPLEPVTMWASDGNGSVVVAQRGGPLLRSVDGGMRWTELPLPVEGISDLWSCRDVVVAATAQGVLASHHGEWLQLLPPSATVCAVVREPRVPRVYACLACPDGWVLVRRPCDDASWRPRIVTRIDRSLGAPVFLCARHDHGETRLYLVGEAGIAKLLVHDA